MITPEKEIAELTDEAQRLRESIAASKLRISEINRQIHKLRLTATFEQRHKLISPTASTSVTTSVTQTESLATETLAV